MGLKICHYLSQFALFLIPSLSHFIYYSMTEMSHRLIMIGSSSHVLYLHSCVVTQYRHNMDKYYIVIHIKKKWPKGSQFALNETAACCVVWQVYFIRHIGKSSSLSLVKFMRMELAIITYKYFRIHKIFCKIARNNITVYLWSYNCQG